MSPAQEFDFAPLLERLIAEIPFPDPALATEDGLLCYGGDLHPERLLAAYGQGVFPWYDESPILWFCPDPRTLLIPGELVVGRSLDKNLRRGRYEVRLDTAFERVIRACAQVPRPEQEGTWLNADMIEAYCKLHELGFAHSAEAFADDGELVGGVYGVSLGAAFFAESMFAIRSDASKVALVSLVRQLEAWDFDFLDCQVHTEHLERFGARPCPRAEFLKRLQRSLLAPTRRGVWQFD